MKFLEKIIVSVLSTLILSLSLAFWEYTPMTEQQAGIAYFSFKGLFIIYFMYSLPVYLIGGGLYSCFVDVYFGKIQFRNKFLKYVYGSIYIHTQSNLTWSLCGNGERQ
ncbi:hypothetical protein [Lentibacillus jeotgali]|uniref:hypothetical protein n=1 Tax=Lentibacillus jeotgali TaxID=558169 RepID=UPI0002628F9F|nr:hypothetical protein [Lentibacillus jeotgali]